MTVQLSADSSALGAPGCRWLEPAVEMAAMATGNWPLSAALGPAHWTCFPRIATRTACPGGRSVRASREFTALTLRRWDVVERSDDIVVVMSELVTNALHHGQPVGGPARSAFPVRYGLVQPGRCVICAVADPGPDRPVIREPGILGETGRGLYVVDALADIWGCTSPGRNGKVVWALFASTVLASPGR